MKRKIYYILMLAMISAFFASCSKESLSDESIIVVDEAEQTPFDAWLKQNYVKPYNIEVQYRMKDVESDMNYYIVPAQYEYSVAMAHLVKYLCLEAYDEVAGVTFTRTYFPKLIAMFGSWQFRNNGTFVLGTAEGGKKISLYGLNEIGQYLHDPGTLNSYYFKTIHHEFTHILNQTKNYPTEFQEVSGADYVADSWSTAPYNTTYLTRGFVSDYAQHSAGEDFAETLSIFVTHDAAYWANILSGAGDKAATIQSKFEIVYNYMKESFGIDLYKLRQTIQRRQKDVVDSKIDLTDVTVEK